MTKPTIDLVNFAGQLGDVMKESTPRVASYFLHRLQN